MSSEPAHVVQTQDSPLRTQDFFRTRLLGRRPRATLARATAIIVIAFVLFRYVLLPVRLTGISMLPTYQDGTFTLVNRLAYWRHEPRRGDAVAIRMAGEHVVYVKRLVGLPRERLEISGGIVMVDGVPLDEPAVVMKAPWSLAPFTLGDREYFVVGDNRAMAIRSHDLGRVSRDRIVGKLLF